jgi:hypothetical protein
VNIPRPPLQYDRRSEDERNRAIEQADSNNYKKGAHLEVGSPFKIILTDSATGLRYALTIENGDIMAAPLKTVSAFGSGFSYDFG